MFHILKEIKLTKNKMINSIFSTISSSSSKSNSSCCNKHNYFHFYCYGVYKKMFD